MDYTIADVVTATGCPRENVSASWPALLAALQMKHVSTRLVQCGIIATVATEVPRFLPIAEYGTHPEYDTGRLAERLGNTPEADGDGQLYEGRGFIQLTGKANYRSYGVMLGIDLLRYPNLALKPDVAAHIMASYFVTRGVTRACEARDWRKVRKLVNGGFNGWDRFAQVVRNLGEHA